MSDSSWHQYSREEPAWGCIPWYIPWMPIVGSQINYLSPARLVGRALSQVRTSVSAAAVAAGSLTPVVVWYLRSGHWAVPALMHLELPRFATQIFSRSGLGRSGLSRGSLRLHEPNPPPPLSGSVTVFRSAMLHCHLGGVKS